MWGAVFPGQGSQQVGMGRTLYDNFDVVRRLFEEASDAISVDMRKLCFDGPESELTLTENTQPALVLVSTAVERTLREVAPVSFDLLSGHSVGEYSALVAAGSMSFASGIRAVKNRGRFMQEAVPVGQGGMLAVIGLDDQIVAQLCSWIEKTSGHAPLEPANFNAPGQVVVSGSLQAIQWLCEHQSEFQIEGSPVKARLIPLNVSAPFHSQMMKPAEENMKSVLMDMEFRDAERPVVQNVTAEPESRSDSLRQNLIAQISAPVMWTQCMRKMKAMGVRNVVELGPRKVLTGLIKKIDSGEMNTFNIHSLADIREFEKQAHS